MLTPKQEQKYWRTWAKIMASRGWAHESSAAKDQRRYGTHIMCGLKNEDGSARSMKTFGNRDFSRWLAATAHLCEEIDIRDRDRENSVWRIRHDAKAAGLSDEYLATIARDKFATSDWTTLTGDQLQKFRNTIHNRAGSHTGHDTRTAPAAPVQARRKYILHDGTGGRGSVRADLPPGSARDPRAVAGDPPATQCPARPLSYCMHAIKPPTVAPTSLPLVPSVPSDDTEPF